MAKALIAAPSGQQSGIRDEASLIAQEPVIHARELVKRYGDMVAVDDVNLSIAPGEIFGILGPNGAGKTTTLEMIEGLRRPDAGAIRVAGFDAVRDSDAVHRVIGVQLQTTALFDYLTAGELIALFASLYNADASPARVKQLLQMVGLEEKREAAVNELSGGQQQRLSLALALVNQPVVVFLDEPTTGLDPQARRNLWDTVRDIRAGGTTVVLTTHYMEEAEQLCDRVAIMDRGRVIACDAPEALIRQLGMAAVVRARIAGGVLPVDRLPGLPGVSGASIEEDGSRTVLLHTADVQATLVALLDLARHHGVTLADLSSTRANLEDVFLNLTGRAYEGEAEGRDAEESPRPRAAGRRRGRRG